MTRFALASLAAAAVACTAPRPDPGTKAAAAVTAGAVASAAPAIRQLADDSGDANPPAPRQPATLTVPRASAPIHPTGHFRADVWGGAATTHWLRDRDGRGSVPVSEARFLWLDDTLYLFFYGGDLDLQARVTKHDGPVWNDDSVVLAFGGTDGAKRIIQISVTGVVADGRCPADAETLADARCDLGWESHVRTATDFDGVLNDTHDRDEEWEVEAAIPLSSLGAGPAAPGTRIPFGVGRCEIAHDGPRSCGFWGGHGDDWLILSAAERDRGGEGADR